MSLFVVATPIGNLGDLSFRAVEVLRDADVIACEDTRVTRKLLQAHDIRTPTESFHAHSGADAVARWVGRLAAGTQVALVTDAGTPTVSDPGAALVAAARAADIDVRVIPGPSALTAAVAASGLPPEPLLFLGFLPRQGRARQTRIGWLNQLPVTGVLYESPIRLPATLRDLASALGDRPAAVTRELTKRFETVVRGTLPELAERFSEPPKGEIAVVIGPGAGPGPSSWEQVDQALQAGLSEGEPPSRLAREVARQTGRPRAAVYDRLKGMKASNKRD